MPARFDVAIVGSGFAGSILARILTRRGRRVVLIDRDRHPRFAIGESATPLAGLALERIAREDDLPDLAHLATCQRWAKHLPGLRHGLKRGFTFYAHRPGVPYENGPGNDARLLVAASPNDAVADAHWLRADVDAHLADRARAEGVALREGALVEKVTLGDDEVAIEGTRAGARFEVRAATVVDATGSGALLASAAALRSQLGSVGVESGLIGAHFRGVRSFVEIARERGARFDDAPYAEERAAVHHLLEEGWMYLLPFDDGVVSAGLVLRGEAGREVADAGARPELFRRVLGRYPSLDAAFRGAQPVTPWLGTPRLQRRLDRAAGPRWLLLPHAYAFVDPMFSTGIAWSLLGVQRAADLLSGEKLPDPDALSQYDALLGQEADQIERLIVGALRASCDFRLFASWSYLYFAWAAAAETRARLDLDPPSSFLDADRREARRLFIEARSALEVALEAGNEAATRRFEGWVAEQIAPFDIAGLADPSRRNLYPVDLDVLVERAGRLGMTPEAMRAALPRLVRGA